MMKDEDLVNLIHSLRDEKTEGEYYEFKKSYLDSEKFGRSISALSNSAALCDQKYGYIIFGIDDTTHEIIGIGLTRCDLNRKKQLKSFEMYFDVVPSLSVDTREKTTRTSPRSFAVK